MLHHGHYCEELYTILSEIYVEGFGGQASTFDVIEAINTGWVELIWYHLGQAGAGIEAQVGDNPVRGCMGEFNPHQFGKGQHFRFDLRERIHPTPRS